MAYRIQAQWHEGLHTIKRAVRLDRLMEAAHGRPHFDDDDHHTSHRGGVSHEREASE